MTKREAVSAGILSAKMLHKGLDRSKLIVAWAGATDALVARGAEEGLSPKETIDGLIESLKVYPTENTAEEELTQR